jgi:hypothetical protein
MFMAISRATIASEQIETTRPRERLIARVIGPKGASLE